MYKFQARFFTLNVRGMDYRMYYHDECDTDKEIIGTILLLHGVNNQCADFDILAHHLIMQGYRVIKPDILGRGKSDWLSTPCDYNISVYAENIVSLLDFLKVSNITVIGTSMGGFISILLANKTGTHFIKKIILNDIGPYVEPKKQLAIAKFLSKQQVFDSFEDIKAHLIKTFSLIGIGDKAHWDIFLRNQIRFKRDLKYHMHYDPKIFDSFVEEASKMKGVDLWEEWKAIPLDIELSVVRGKLSPMLTNKIIDDMKSIRNDLKVLVIEGIGHAPIFYQEEHIIQLCKLL